MSNKYFDGFVKSTGVTGEADAHLKAVVTGTRDRIAKKMEKLRVADAISEVFALFTVATNTLTRQHLGYLQRTRHSKIVLQRFFTI